MPKERDKFCRCCGALLDAGAGGNWPQGQSRSRNYICQACKCGTSRKYRADNPDAFRKAVLKAQLKRRNSDPEAWRESRRPRHSKRRALKAGSTVGDLSAIRELESHRWAAEGFTGGTVHLDHIIPLSRGGTHCAENLRYLPARLNYIKGNRLDSEVTDSAFREWADTGPRFEQVACIVRRAGCGAPSQHNHTHTP